MQEWLHAAEAEAKRLQIPLDANTQLMIDQSRELGLWVELGPTPTEMLIEGMTELVRQVGLLLEGLYGVRAVLGDMPDPNIPIPGAPGSPDPDNPSAGISGGSSLIGLRSSLFTGSSSSSGIPTGTGRGVSTSASGSAVTINVVSQLDGKQIARNQIRMTPAELRRLGLLV